MEEQRAAVQPLTDLHERVALVTGASSGIGAAITEQLVRRGAHVAMFARRTARLEALAARLAPRPAEGEHFGETLIVTGDVRVPDHVQEAVRQTLARWGRLDVLIANAGFGYRSPLVDRNIQRWKDMIDTNVYGLLPTLKYGVAPMLERGSGHPVVTSSIAGRVATPGGSAYCGPKFPATALPDSPPPHVAPNAR